MNIKKAIGAGLLVFAIQFTIANIVSNMAGPFLTEGSWGVYTMQIVMTLILVAIVCGMARWYFTGNSATCAKGSILGLIFVAVGFAVSMLQIVPAIILKQDILQPLMQYMISIPFLVPAAVTVGAATLAGHMSMKRSACNAKDAVSSCMPSDADKAKKDKAK